MDLLEEDCNERVEGGSHSATVTSAGTGPESEFSLCVDPSTRFLPEEE